MQHPLRNAQRPWLKFIDQKFVVILVVHIYLCDSRWVEAFRNGYLPYPEGIFIGYFDVLNLFIAARHPGIWAVTCSGRHIGFSKGAFGRILEISHLGGSLQHLVSPGHSLLLLLGFRKK